MAGIKLVGTGSAGSFPAQGTWISLSADGNTVAIGGNNDGSTGSGGIGATWIFIRSGGVWTQQGSKLVGTGATGRANQGWSVALSGDGDTLAVGGFTDNSYTGAVWIWTRSGGVWTQQGSKLVGTGGSGASQGQGTAVALNYAGDTLAVGAAQDNSVTGAVWIWTRSGGVWTQQGSKLVGTGATGAAAQGQNIALNNTGDILAVSGTSDASSKGAVWIFIRSGGVWTQQGSKLVGTGTGTGSTGQGLGVALNAAGDVLAVGGPYDNSGDGAVWIWTSSGGVWTQQGSKIVGTGATGAYRAQQGISVALNAAGDRLVVSGSRDNGQKGSIWFFIYSGGTWTQQGSKIGDPTSGNLGIGSISLNAVGDTVAVGAPYTAPLGATYIFSVGPVTTTTTTTPAPKVTTAPAPVTANRTKVLLIRGQDSVAASGTTTGGFVNVASLMHEVVKKMTDNGWNVVYSSVDNDDLGTVSWGTLNAVSWNLSWTAPAAPPTVGMPTTDTTYPVSGGPTASIILEAGERLDALNRASPIPIPGVTPTEYYPAEPWRVKFELLSTECVAAYVAAPLQLPGYYAYGSTLVAEPWGLPGTNSRIVKTAGVPLDAAGAIGAQQIISSHKQVTLAVIDDTNTGAGFAVGDFLYEDAYAGVSTAPTSNTGLYYVLGSTVPLPPLPTRYRAIFKVESISNPTTAAPGGVATGEIKSLSIVVSGKYHKDVAVDGTVLLKTLTGAGTGSPRANLTLSTGCSAVDELDPYQGLYSRGGRVGANGASYPLTYELALCNNGFFLGIYESSWATQVGGKNITTGATASVGRFNWMVVQRPVDRNTGIILDGVYNSTSKHPVFCINSVGGRYCTFVVREKDISHPTGGPDDHTTIAYYNAGGTGTGTLVSRYVNTATQPYNNYKLRVPAVLNSEDSHLLFNPENQISLTEDKKYLVSFPRNLSTPRFRYTEEIDLIGLTSSELLMTGQITTISTYGESASRTYLTLPPSGKFNTGLRICVVATTPNGAY